MRARAAMLAGLLALSGSAHAAEQARSVPLPARPGASVTPARETLREAFERVRVGMTLVDLMRVHPGLLAGEVHSVQTAGHRYETRTYDLDPGTATLVLRDGVVQSISR